MYILKQRRGIGPTLEFVGHMSDGIAGYKLRRT